MDLLKTISQLLFPVLSSLGIGMVCGWLTGMMAFCGDHPGRNILYLLFADAIVGFCIFLVFTWWSVIIFFSALVILLLIYFNWRRELALSVY